MLYSDPKAPVLSMMSSLEKDGSQSPVSSRDNDSVVETYLEDGLAIPHHQAQEQLLYGHVYDVDPIHENMVLLPRVRAAPMRRVTTERLQSSFYRVTQPTAVAAVFGDDDIPGLMDDKDSDDERTLAQRCAHENNTSNPNPAHDPHRG